MKLKPSPSTNQPPLNTAKTGMPKIRRPPGKNKLNSVPCFSGRTVNKFAMVTRHITNCAATNFMYCGSFGLKLGAMTGLSLGVFIGYCYFKAIQVNTLLCENKDPLFVNRQDDDIPNDCRELTATNNILNTLCATTLVSAPAMLVGAMAGGAAFGTAGAITGVIEGAIKGTAELLDHSQDHQQEISRPSLAREPLSSIKKHPKRR